MSVIFQAEAPPLREGSHGELRVGNTGVLLETVIHAFEMGSSAEQIVHDFDTLSLPDVYAVIAYYLRHREIVQSYMDRSEKRAEEVEARVGAQQGDLAELRNRISAARNKLPRS